jgi:hypothetical protein
LSDYGDDLTIVSFKVVNDDVLQANRAEAAAVFSEVLEREVTLPAVDFLLDICAHAGDETPPGLVDYVQAVTPKTVDLSEVNVLPVTAVDIY